MGLFDIFKKNKKPKIRESNGNRLVPTKSNQLSHPTDYFSIHADIKNLIWIENGAKRNFVPDKGQKETYKFGGIVVTLSLSGGEEPSLIDMQQEIKEPLSSEEVPSPPYYPNYKSLSPEQKYKYWQFLSNPYHCQRDISYVFILYYGLERHLFTHDFENAVKTVIKLREIHKNSSFQSYSGNAIVLSCLLHQRADMMQVFIESLNQDYKRGFSDNLYLFALHSFDVPLLAKDIMRLAKTFGFTNTNYIKGYPDVFEQTMEKLIFDKYTTKNIILKDITPRIQTLPKTEMRLFANISLMDEVVIVPDMISSNELWKVMNDLLVNTHESVKKHLAEMRKNKVVLKKKETKKPPQKIKFDATKESDLLGELKSNYNDLVTKHFIYIQLQDFYYKYRDLDPEYLEACIRYCYEDIEILDELNKVYVNQEIDRHKKLGSFYSNEDLDKDIQRIKKEKFRGRIPAFSRLAIIYEKRKEYNYAIKISKQAITYYNNQGMETSEFEKRIDRLQKKLET
ncbi:TerB N-terminal domain-containing protein [Virgibacillus dakarensis]|uniref:TerB N-terminal domain-containing protein n=1 Tax=Cytobacillus kochii TaxID=859143 RepID=UPI001BDFF2FE|nr:TerB N-terminal domain-containing protein [Cytobacillus kochii]MBT2217994.1 TerB N-terminal domain-containing protein [Virgibacillus dakarensis]MCA1025040.1 TerB N-terminal domain-containing protein [Cytobacillus kochii]